MVQTRRKAQLQAIFEHGHILKLPAELHRIIFECLMTECPVWLASLTTLCKTLMPEVEAVLYREVEIGTCKRTSMFCRAVVKRRYRAAFVKKLLISLRGGTTSKPHLKQALPILTNLSFLELTVDDPEIFDIMLDVPFRLRHFAMGGDYYPARMEDILARQPDLESLSLVFMSGTAPEEQPQLSRPDIFPSLTNLTIFSHCYSPTNITYPYRIPHIAIAGARHDEIAHVIKMFTHSLESLDIIRFMDDRCTAACYWPTSMFRNAQLPKLQHVKVSDLYDPDSDDLPCDPDTMRIPGLSESCPALKTLMWSVDAPVMLDLWGPRPDDALGEKVMTRYAHMLFGALPALERFSVHELGGPARDREHGIHGEVFRRGESGEVQGPTLEPVELDPWALYAELL